MTIDNAFLIQSAVTGGGAIFIGIIGWTIKHNVIDRAKRIESKVDSLSDVVNQMKVDNADDHAKVVERIANLEGKMDGFRAPWHRSDS